MTDKMTIPSETFASRTFNQADQEKFALLSGDVNPVHLDTIAARRTQAGAPVVHGVHALLWTLESLAAADKLPLPILSVAADFKKFIYVGAPVEARIVNEVEDSLEVELLSDGVFCAVIHVNSVAQGEHTDILSAEKSIVYGSGPASNNLEDIAGMSGHISAPKAGVDEIEAVFPRIAMLVGKDRLLSIVLTSTLVGMVCPGLHSIFGSLAVRLAALDDNVDGLNFSVSNVDERFRMVEVKIAGNRMRGEITAFVRVPPIDQPGFSEIAGRIESMEFQTTTALIIGGSRGLGAAVAKVIAAGGGRAILTYASGRLEAEGVRNEICAARGMDACRIMQYDVREDFKGRVGEIDWPVNQLYYFATPQIYRQSATLYSAAMFGEFLRFYVDGFFSVAMALLHLNASDLKIFYPSSIFVDHLPKGMIEYSMAKGAGELLCQYMNKYMNGVRIISPRLPRMLTDQSATIIPSELDDVLEIMLRWVRRMHENPQHQSASWK